MNVDISISAFCGDIFCGHCDVTYASLLHVGFIDLQEPGTAFAKKMHPCLRSIISDHGI